MGLGLANAYGTEALSKAIQDIIAQKKSEAIAAQAEAYKRSQDAVKNGQQDRIIGADEGRLKLAQNQFSDIQKPESVANIAHTGAETAGLVGNETRTATDYADAKALENLMPNVSATPGVVSPRQALQIRRLTKIDPTTAGFTAMTQSPTQAGQAAGTQESAAFNSGGSNVFRQKLNFETAAKIAEENAKPKTTSPAVTQSSYQYTNGELGKLEKPIRDRMDNVQQALQLVNASTPQADALVAPAILKAEVGGAGSGLRMTTAEINNVMGGRGKWESLKAALQKWNPSSGQALSITADQRADMQRLLATLNDRTQMQLSIIRDAGQRLSVSEDGAEHKKILAETQQKLDEALNASQSSGVVKWGRDAQGRPVIVK